MAAPECSDTRYMARAIELAKQGLYTASPNPRVGCVIVKNNKIVAEGFHLKTGENHAEANALSQLTDKTQAHGATVYVTLEPCCHTNKRTPPCAQALIDAKVSRVIFGMEDPNPEVSGKGIAQLKAAGIQVEGAVCENECRALNSGFIKRMQTGLPFVRVKLAMSLDGRTAMQSGESKWITGAEAREDVQQLRAQSDAIITGIETVLADDPQLNVRSERLPQEALENQPLRVILDRNNRLSLAENKNAKILHDKNEVLVINDNPDLKILLKNLAKKNCNDVLIEAGAMLAGAFVEQGLVDELIIYMAPKLLGSDARPLLQLPFDKMNQQIALNIKEIKPIGDDWRITATPSSL